jgi:hypothetical protein
MGTAWFQRLKLKYDMLVTNFAFNINSRRYLMDGMYRDLNGVFGREQNLNLAAYGRVIEVRPNLA